MKDSALSRLYVCGVTASLYPSNIYIYNTLNRSVRVCALVHKIDLHLTLPTKIEKGGIHVINYIHITTYP